MKTRFDLRLILVAPLLFLLAACSSSWRYDPITDVNDLEGRKVGVNLAWESDYLLSDRDDMQLFRYDETSDMIMALSYNKVDAIAMDSMSWAMLEKRSQGVEHVEEPFGSVGVIMFFGTDDEELAEDFNSYLKEFKQTDAYRDLVERFDSFDGLTTNSPDIPLTGTGKVINVSLNYTYYPRVWVEPRSDVPTGYDLEILKHYANDRNYQLNFIDSEYLNAIIGLLMGSADVFVGYLSDTYAEEARDIGLYVSDAMYMDPMYFVQKAQENIAVRTEEL